MALSPDEVEARVTDLGFKGPLSDLGWRNKAYDHPEVCALRERLIRDAGIPNLEIVDPAVPGFAQRAAELLDRDGFVVVKDVLDEARLSKIRKGAEIAVREMVGRDPERSGNRGSHRYSFGAAPAHFGLQAEWAVLIDPPALSAVLIAVFGTPDYICSSASSCGDYNVPGSVQYQDLHSDGGGSAVELADGRTVRDYPNIKREFRAGGAHRRVALDAPEHPALRYDIVNTRALPVREVGVTVNYPMEICAGSDVGHTPFNGATRQIPGTHSMGAHNGNPIPGDVEEPLWMKMSTTSPAPAGCCMIRDNRAWHGGTPNLGKHVRAIPHPGGFRLPPPEDGSDAPRGRRGPTRDLPHAVWQEMTPHGQHVCRLIVAEPGETVVVDWKPDYASQTPGRSKQTATTVAKL
jgi:hypothetical protein